MIKTRVKREIFRGKAYVVARVKGKIISMRKYNKDFTTTSGKQQIKQTGTLHKDRIRTRLVNVSEVRYIIETEKQKDGRIKIVKAPRRSSGRYQYVVSTIINGKTISGRSDFTEGSRKEARAEAYERFLGNLAEYFGFDYNDSLSAMKTIDEKGLKINEEYIQYSET